MIQRAKRPDAGFLLIRNEVVRDKRLSYRARGLLAMMLSYPDDWTFTREWLAEQSSKEGVDAIRTALKELADCGYLLRKRVRLPDGRFGWERILYDTPQTVIVAGGTTGGSATGGNPTDGQPPSNRRLSRTTEDEDVNDLICPDSGRCAPSVGGAQNQQTELHDDQPTDDTATTAAEVNDWRRQDREAFRMHVGDVLISLGHDWREGWFTADAFYTAFRKKKGRIRWPGRMLENLYAAGGEQGIDDWLLDQGLERAA